MQRRVHGFRQRRQNIDPDIGNLAIEKEEFGVFRHGRDYYNRRRTDELIPWGKPLQKPPEKAAAGKIACPTAKTQFATFALRLWRRRCRGLSAVLRNSAGRHAFRGNPEGRAPPGSRIPEAPG